MVTGPVLKPNLPSIGSNGVSVPGEYHTVVYDPTGSEKMITFVLPNKKGTKSLEEYVVSVDYVESQTGIDFFPQMVDYIENILEAQSDASQLEF